MFVYSPAAASDHSDCDCFGCAILSHGREGFVYATDRLIPLEALTVPFKGDRCPTLVGKPKLFFLQVCILSHVMLILYLVIHVLIFTFSLHSP